MSKDEPLYEDIRDKNQGFSGKWKLIAIVGIVMLSVLALRILNVSMWGTDPGLERRTVIYLTGIGVGCFAGFVSRRIVGDKRIKPSK